MKEFLTFGHMGVMISVHKTVLNVRMDGLLKTIIEGKTSK